MSEKKNEDIRILVLQRGRVVVGRFTMDGAMITLTDSRVVRRWGTNAGLEQLANQGPRAQTVLEEPLKGPRQIHILTTIEMLSCNPEAWRAVL